MNFSLFFIPPLPLPFLFSPSTNYDALGDSFVTGVIISAMQAIFSAVFYFVAIPLFPGILMVGYATIFTMFPVFSLVLDKDLPDSMALTYPELYKELTKGRDLTFKTFFVWMLISIYQGEWISTQIVVGFWNF
ncbi:unnamed protein product [Protopolystoma xenopodis]|uniref:P-type ATPase C-terminal domain-containing protein n=1 Tax=Protopolystoma xenopodis TaxID=117903 RepID=A0A3S5AIG8_9PLAT|nr:unnamed protein product [Protopolystoma xenopodis]